MDTSKNSLKPRSNAGLGSSKRRVNCAFSLVYTLPSSA